jgi:DNA polymerase-3 subunit epsilon
MGNRLKPLFLSLLGLAVLLLTGGAIVAVQSAGPAAAGLRGPVYGYTLVAAVMMIAAVVLVWAVVERRALGAARALDRDIKTLLQAKQIDRHLRVPPKNLLGDLPGSIELLVDELRGARHEVVKAMVTATARMEQEKGWLEMILLELVREGVIVCSTKHRILLYNHPAARLFRASHALGLGRSLFDVVASAPIEHGLERLQGRRQRGQTNLSLRMVCAPVDGRSLFQARMALVLDPAGEFNGYVLTLEDISAQMEERQRAEAVRRTVTRDLRGPLGSLRAAAENLFGFPDMEERHRLAFREVILKEATALCQRVEEISESYSGQREGQWPTSDIHSPDLFNCVAAHLHERTGPIVQVLGEAQWLQGDSYSLMLVLEHLISRVASFAQVAQVMLQAQRKGQRVFVDVQWNGGVPAAEELTLWLSESLLELPGGTVGELLEHHGSEPWVQALDEGGSVLRIPLQAPATLQDEATTDKLPPRPEFYDFDLLQDQEISEELANRPVRELSYAIFDTETTGLKPAHGDEIIAIAAARVTQGRVLSGETFESLINPGRPIPKDSIRFHGITDEQVKDKPPIAEVLPSFHSFVGDAVLVAHNAAFDMKFLRLKEAQCGIRFENPVVDTMLLSLLIEGDDEDHSLDGICSRLGITVEGRHSALGDAIATAEVFSHFLDRLEAINVRTFGDLMRATNMEAELRFRTTRFEQV